MEELYTEMAAAIKQRNHAIAMLKRWQAVLDSAEAQMTKLSGALANVQITEASTEQFETVTE